MKRVLLVAFVCTSLAALPPASAADDSAKILQRSDVFARACKVFLRDKVARAKFDNPLNAAMVCASYLTAILDQNFAAQDKAKRNEIRPSRALDFCLASHHGAQHTAPVVVRYMRRNPKFGAQQPILIVTLALAEAYPCK